MQNAQYAKILNIAYWYKKIAFMQTKICKKFLDMDIYIWFDLIWLIWLKYILFYYLFLQESRSILQNRELPIAKCSIKYYEFQMHLKFVVKLYPKNTHTQIFGYHIIYGI